MVVHAIYLVNAIKSSDGLQQFYRAGVDQIDNHIPEQISRQELERQLGLT